jgi:hypothetical protein
MVEWFKHDFKARTHPRLQRIQMKYGMEGVGIYWSLIEMLYEEDGRLMLSECDAYAFALRTDSERLASFIKECGAFIFDGDVFYSDTVNERMQERADKSEKASLSAKKRWEDANAMRTHSEGNAIREDKSREDKSREDKEKRKRFAPPTVDDVFEIMQNRKESELFVTYYASKDWKVGKSPMKDWKQAVRGWIVRGNVKPEVQTTREQYANYGSSIG